MQPGSEEDFILNVGRRTYFTQGSAALDSVAKATLDIQIAWLTKHPRWLLKLQGFADDPGSSETALSQQCADAVIDYLAAGGIDRNRMWAKGYGKDRLVRDCPTPPAGRRTAGWFRTCGGRAVGGCAPAFPKTEAGVGKKLALTRSANLADTHLRPNTLGFSVVT